MKSNDQELVDELLELFKEDPKREAHMEALADAFYEELTREQYCEYGGWGLDDKRPFGNSYVVGDMADIVGIDLPDEEDDARDEVEAYLHELYDDLGLYLKYRWELSKKK